MDPGSSPRHHHPDPPLPHGDRQQPHGHGGEPELRLQTHISPHRPAASSPCDTSSPPDAEPADNSPVFWTTASPTRHARSLSYHSIASQRPAQISLEDHSEESHELSRSCWAQSATVDQYVVVSGPTGIGAYIVWHCTVQTLKGGDLNLRKRYSEFDTLRANLVTAFPHAAAMIPALPRKSVVSRFRPDFLALRRAGLEHFLNCILLNPEFAASPILKDFIFA